MTRPTWPKMLERLLRVAVGAWLVWQFANWIIKPEPVSLWFWVGLAGPIFAVLLVAVIMAIKER